MLNRLLLLGVGRTMALMGRGGRFPGEAGGELAMVDAKRGSDGDPTLLSFIQRAGPTAVGQLAQNQRKSRRAG
jgi:hypothetical protein